MVFPDGTLSVPSGSEYLNYGPILEIDDLDAVLSETDFDSPKHQQHSRGWHKSSPKSKKKSAKKSKKGK